MLGAGLAPGRFSVKTLAFTCTTDQEHGKRMEQARERCPTPMPTTSHPSALLSPGRHAGLRRAPSASKSLTLAHSPRYWGPEHRDKSSATLMWKIHLKDAHTASQTKRVKLGHPTVPTKAAPEGAEGYECVCVSVHVCMLCVQVHESARVYVCECVGVHVCMLSMRGCVGT